MHARISMSEQEDRSMIAHARDEARGAFYFSLTSFIVGTIRIISTVSMASAVRNRRCPWKLELYVSCAFLDR